MTDLCTLSLTHADRLRDLKMVFKGLAGETSTALNGIKGGVDSKSAALVRVLDGQQKALDVAVTTRDQVSTQMSTLVASNAMLITSGAETDAKIALKDAKIAFLTASMVKAKGGTGKIRRREASRDFGQELDINEASDSEEEDPRQVALLSLLTLLASLPYSAYLTQSC